jgi:hypothetical protein
VKAKQSLVVPALCLAFWMLARSQFLNFENAQFLRLAPTKGALARPPFDVSEAALKNVHFAEVAQALTAVKFFERQSSVPQSQTFAFTPQRENNKLSHSASANFVQKPLLSDLTQLKVGTASTPPFVSTLEPFPEVSKALAAEPRLEVPPRADLPRGAKLSGSFWTLVRPGANPAAIAENGQIGGAQAGFRMSYPVIRIGNSLELSASSRTSFPLNDKKQIEGTIGAMFVVKGRVPLNLILERRMPLRNIGDGAWSITAATGVNDLKISRNILVDGYIQGGIVGAKSQTKFVGGSAVVSIPASKLENTPLRLGIGIWGDAQPNAARLDIGPDVSVKTKILGISTRVSAQWRFRISGDAQPNSGPAVVIGGDF